MFVRTIEEAHEDWFEAFDEAAFNCGYEEACRLIPSWKEYLDNAIKRGTIRVED